MKKKVKLISSTLSIIMLSSLAIACSDKTDKQSTPSSSAPVEQTAISYPLKSDTKLSLWTADYTPILQIKPNVNDIPFYQEWQKKTGVGVNFQNPVAGQEKEQLNVMLSSGDLPDMIEYNWKTNFPGGPEKAIKDGVIMKLNDVIDKYAPNLKKYLKEHPEVDKMVKTDNGSYYAFPFVRGDESLMVFQGPMLRQDYLTELGLQVPTTMDEWYTVLKAFKEKKGMEAPLTFRGLNDLNNGAFIGAYGINRSFYVDNGQVKYGPAQPSYKDFLATMRKWYAEGLLDKNIATVDIKAQDANMTSGKSGASIGAAGSGMGKWLGAVQGKDPKYNLVAAPYPVLNKGDKPKFGQKSFAFGSEPSGMIAITGTSKNVELAAKFLDYGYSEEGHNFFNFGTEGVSYKMDNGYPKYTDLLMNNPEKLSLAQAMGLYIRGNTSGPFVQDPRYLEQYYTMKQQKDAIVAWQQTDAAKYMLPPITASPQESTELAKIMNEVNALVDETSLKIILGAAPLEEYDKYLSKLQTLNINRAIEIQKAALDRYNKR
ncbi:extracellular solute-binding protein [Paenibacillus chondroitinus]|uniref:Extracellular solute-binding protein n=1 Tax=Paenibacillus chondroitinus TaxID=59842 RepID=A0ABU6D7V0_9BACL|nr:MULTISPECIES: extracellular solute-binding protein [Paenibacillus]MCY9660130.1 extracellular solute-binding protein [Paenibacillus anseongense]MEB4793011.1 extracellular solute-binding protein [Paenibacillus chondroitinus]